MEKISIMIPYSADWLWQVDRYILYDKPAWFVSQNLSFLLKNEYNKPLVKFVYQLQKEVTNLHIIKC